MAEIRTVIISKQLALTALVAVGVCSCGAGESQATGTQSFSSSAEEAINVKVQGFCPTKATAAELSPLLEKLNAEAIKQSQTIGIDFTFSLATSNDCDLWLNAAPASSEYDPSAYLTLPSEIQQSLQKQDFIRPVHRFLDESSCEKTFIPLSYDFSGMGFDSTIYDPSDLTDLDGAYASLKEKKLFGGGNYYAWSLLSDNDFIHYGDWDRADDDGNPVLADPALDSFYFALNKALIRDPQKTFQEGLAFEEVKLGHLGSMYYSEISEPYHLASWPTIRVENKEVKTVSWGNLYGASFDKNASARLGDKAIVALATFLLDSEGKVSKWDEGKLPVRKEAIKELNGFAGDVEFIENRTMIIHGASKGFDALSRLIYELKTVDGEAMGEGYSFAAQFKSFYEQ